MPSLKKVTKKKTKKSARKAKRKRRGWFVALQMQEQPVYNLKKAAKELGYRLVKIKD